MKKALVLLVCLSITFASCKKNSSNAPANTISANINGVDESFNTGGSAHLGSGVQLNSVLTITGANGTAAGADVMSISINSNVMIAEGVYTNASNNTTSFPALLYSKGPF